MNLQIHNPLLSPPLILRGSWRGIPKVLILILGLALLLRLAGINYGLPYFFVGDEQSQLGAALVMLKTFNVIPAAAPADFQLLYYPPLMSYFYLIILVPVLLVWMFFAELGPQELAQAVVLDPTIPWLAGRIFVAGLGVLSVYLIYLLARRIFSVFSSGEKVGLLAAFFLATSFLPTSLSSFTRHWTPTIFFEILVMLAAFNIWKFGRLKDYFWAAAFAALAFGVGFIGIISAFFPLIAHFARGRKNYLQSLKDKNLWQFIGLLSFLVVGIILLYPQRFLEISKGTDITVAHVKTLGGFIAAFGYELRTLLLADPLIFVFSTLGIFLGIRFQRNLVLIFLAYAVIYISVLYFFIHNELRYISFLYPGLVILTARAADFLIEKLKSAGFARLVSRGLLIILICYPLAVSGKFAWLLQQDDTRISAKKWVQKNLPTDTKIFSLVKPEVLTPSKEAIGLQRNLDEGSLRTLDKVLLKLADDKYPQSYDLLSWPKLSSERLNLREEVRQFNPQYIIIQYWGLEDYLKIPAYLKSDPYPIKFTPGFLEGGIDFLGNFNAPTFILFKMQRFGPIVEVHKL